MSAGRRLGFAAIVTLFGLLFASATIERAARDARPPIVYPTTAPGWDFAADEVCRMVLDVRPSPVTPSLIAVRARDSTVLSVHTAGMEYGTDPSVENRADLVDACRRAGYPRQSPTE